MMHDHVGAVRDFLTCLGFVVGQEPECQYHGPYYDQWEVFVMTLADPGTRTGFILTYRADEGVSVQVGDGDLDLDFDALREGCRDMPAAQFFGAYGITDDHVQHVHTLIAALLRARRDRIANDDAEWA